MRFTFVYAASTEAPCLVNQSINLKARAGERTPSITQNEFYNIKLICNHFKPALDEWQAAKNIKFPTPEQVMCK